MSPRQFRTLVILAAVWSASNQARGVINIDMPVPKIFDAVRVVAVGTITGINGENHVIELKTAETLKGTPLGETFRVQLATPPGMIGKVAADLPLVLFAGEDLGKPVALIHVADTWLLAELLAGAKVPSWRVIQAYPGKRSFAGSTAELVKVVTALRADK